MNKSHAALFWLPLVLAAPLAAGQTVQQTNLTSDGKIKAAFKDPNLRNPWGVSFSPGGNFWVSDNDTGLTTLYDGTGAPQSLVVTIPPPAGGTGPSAPTGQVYNSSPDYAVSQGGKSGAALFIFATEDGTVSGWSPSVNQGNAVLAIDNSQTGAVYKGLAIVPLAKASELMVTNFRSGYVEIYDDKFNAVSQFRDTSLPADYAPYNVAVLNKTIYVTYAKQDKAKHDSVSGAGFGYVSIVSPTGETLTQLVMGGPLNAPWGLALAPSSWGAQAGLLAVGNFGDGWINLFNPTTGAYVQPLMTSAGPLAIKGLWDVIQGNGGGGGSASDLYFTAGPNHEKHGVFGSLSFVP